MSLVGALGAVGLGLAGGWLAGLFAGAGPRRPNRTALAPVGATLCLGGEALAFAGIAGFQLFSSAAAPGLTLHFGWRRWLDKRFGGLSNHSTGAAAEPL